VSFWQFLRLNWSELLSLVQQHVVLVSSRFSLRLLFGVPNGEFVDALIRSLRGPGAGSSQRDADESELALIGFPDSASVYRRHWNTHGPSSALVLLFAPADHRNTVTGILGVDPKCAKLRWRWGMTGQSGAATGRVAACYGRDRHRAFAWPRSLQSELRRLQRGRRRWLGCLHFSRAATVRQQLVTRRALLSAALLALAADFFLGLVQRQFSFEAKRSVAVRHVRKLCSRRACWFW
jgi:hypothetical protein